MAFTSWIVSGGRREIPPTRYLKMSTFPAKKSCRSWLAILSVVVLFVGLSTGQALATPYAVIDVIGDTEGPIPLTVNFDGSNSYDDWGFEIEAIKPINERS